MSSTVKTQHPTPLNRGSQPAPESGAQSRARARLSEYWSHSIAPKMEMTALLLRMLRKGQMSPTKVRNALKDGWAMWRRTTGVGPAPVVMQIEPVSGCNLDCLFCPADNETETPDYLAVGHGVGATGRRRHALLWSHAFRAYASAAIGQCRQERRFPRGLAGRRL